MYSDIVKWFDLRDDQQLTIVDDPHVFPIEWQVKCH